MVHWYDPQWSWADLTPCLHKNVYLACQAKVQWFNGLIHIHSYIIHSFVFHISLQLSAGRGKVLFADWLSSQFPSPATSTLSLSNNPEPTCPPLPTCQPLPYGYGGQMMNVYAMLHPRSPWLAPSIPWPGYLLIVYPPMVPQPFLGHLAIPPADILPPMYVLGRVHDLIDFRD